MRRYNGEANAKYRKWQNLSGSVEFRTVCFIDVIFVSRSVSLALTSIASWVPLCWKRWLISLFFLHYASRLLLPLGIADYDSLCMWRHKKLVFKCLTNVFDTTPSLTHTSWTTDLLKACFEKVVICTLIPSSLRCCLLQIWTLSSIDSRGQLSNLAIRIAWMNH